MIKAYKLTIEQFNLINGKEFTKDSLFLPFQDFNGDYYISKEEVEQCDVLQFNWVKDLELADYIRFKPTTELLPYAVEIPEIYQWAFPEDKFVLSGFEIPLDTYQSIKVVNLAYFQWAEFRAELDSGNYEALKRSLMPLWDYVAEQVTNNNIIVL
jgi:hypothetical protein